LEEQLTGDSDERSPGNLRLLLHVDLKGQQDGVDVKLEGQYAVAVEHGKETGQL